MLLYRSLQRRLGFLFKFSIAMANLVILTGHTKMFTESAMPLNTLFKPKNKFLHTHYLLNNPLLPTPSWFTCCDG